MSKLGSRKLYAQTKTNNTHIHKVTIATNDKKCEERVYNEDILEFVQKTSSTEFEEIFGKLQLQQHRKGHPRKV